MYKFDDSNVRRNEKGRLVYRRDLSASELLCFDCEWVKPRDDFGINPKGNPRSQCKPCVQKYITDRYRVNSDKWLEYRIRHHFNITIEQYWEMFEAQGGVCKICRKPETVKKRGTKVTNLSLDHDHACCPIRGKSCGKCIRGLLCSLCNHALGIIESVGSVDPFAEYLAAYASA